MASDDLLQSSPVPVSVEQAAMILESDYGIVGKVRPLPGDRDCNFAIHGRSESWMLKVANPAESMAVLRTQQLLLRHLRETDPSLPVPEPIATATGELVTQAQVGDVLAPVRVTTFLAGTTVEDTGWSPQLRRHAAEILARIDLALGTFSPAAIGAPELWHPTRILFLRPHTEHLGPDRRRFAEGWLDHFEATIAERLNGMRRQLIHGDLNPANIIVDPQQPDLVAGIIDFGDTTLAPLISDLAILIAYQCLDTDEPQRIAAEAAATYGTVIPLTRDEIEILTELVISRLVQSLIISAWRAQLHPDNRDYILIHAEPVWSALQRFDTGSMDIAAALDRRQAHLGPGLRLSYDQPLHAASAEGVWITDTAGIRHLDAYNNVAHVGHGHPDVVAALSRQAGRLNTNTRYLVDEVSRYAARVAGLLPDPLEVVYFANSGGEANDLAWRIARTVTGRKGMIITEHAYHGSTYLTMATSPEELGTAELEPWVATVPAPSADVAGARDVAAAIARLEQAGEEAAAYVCDTVFSSDGIFEPPAGYLAEVYGAIRDAGGLCIADEVQAGFGRVGSRWWGFSGHRVVPDIVTLGKPMGNGHPLAAVVTTRAIGEEFSRTGYYFSTFAGNPVSAAVGEAVLDVLERDRLPEQADRVGAYLRSALLTLAKRHRLITDVRGPGMFIGVELSSPDGSPATRAAKSVMNGMRERYVLVGCTGPCGNVLKIRPPLVFAEEHSDLLVDTLGVVLGEL